MRCVAGSFYKIKKLLLQVSGGIHELENYKNLLKVKVLTSENGKTVLSLDKSHSLLPFKFKCILVCSLITAAMDK